MSMLAFFPWIDLENEIAIGDYRLVPYIRGRLPAAPDSELQATLDGILEPYKAGNYPIRKATLLQIGDGELTRELDDDQCADAFQFAEIVAISGLAARKYFTRGLEWYWNRDQFYFVIRAFTEAGKGTLIVIRRRDGNTNMLVTAEAYRVQPRLHVLAGRVKLDVCFAKALLDSRASDEWERYWDSIINFNLANTDSADMRMEVEAVFTIAAFERLLGCRRGDEDDLAGRFIRVLKPKTALAPSSCPRLSDPATPDSLARRASVREAWIRDFFRGRGNYAHGTLEPKHSAVWSLREHLLLSSYAYPLTLKSLLAKDGRYVVSEDDQFDIDLFEALMGEDLFAEVEDLASSPWNDVRDGAYFRRLAERAANAIYAEGEQEEQDQ